MSRSDQPQLTTTSPGTGTEATIGRTMLLSIGWTTIAMFVLTGAPIWLLTGEVWNGIGLGSFCAFWGGPGFGTMVGGALWAHRCERQAATENPADNQAQHATSQPQAAAAVPSRRATPTTDGGLLPTAI